MGSTIQLDAEELEQACKNIGFDLTCGACASLFYTGYADYGHDQGCKTYTKHEKGEIANWHRLEWLARNGASDSELGGAVKRLMALEAVQAPRDNPADIQLDAEETKTVQELLANPPKPSESLKKILGRTAWDIFTCSPDEVNVNIDKFTGIMEQTCQACFIPFDTDTDVPDLAGAFVYCKLPKGHSGDHSE